MNVHSTVNSNIQMSVDECIDSKIYNSLVQYIVPSLIVDIKSGEPLSQTATYQSILLTRMEVESRHNLFGLNRDISQLVQNQINKLTPR